MPGAHTTKALRTRNRASVLAAILRGGPTTRNRLSRDLDLSVGTITNVTGDLVEEGLVHESGLLPSDGGRPSAVLCAAAAGAYFVGADVGESGVTVELFDLDLRPVARVFEASPAPASTVEEIAIVLHAGISEVLEQCPDRSRVFGVGLGVPGIVEPNTDVSARGAPTGYTIHAQSIGWPATSLATLYAVDGLPVFVDNGAKTLAWGEQWLGAAADVTDSVTLLLGRGLGAGIISGGRFLHGSVGSAGEWGHTKVTLTGPVCGCGQRGCLEAHVGGAALARRWREASKSPLTTAEDLVAELLIKAGAGDADAVAIVAEAVEILGIGMATLINLFNPSRVVLGGWAGLMLADSQLDALAASARAASLERPGNQFELTAARVGSEGVALGAALLAVQGLIDAPASWATVPKEAVR